ncbi:MAG: hypothetical protein INR66_17175, partial [Gordonia polyisoprenivorans]|nr:hypothetical protein [Gordonia polyisoprenivorans]
MPELRMEPDTHRHVTVADSPEPRAIGAIGTTPRGERRWLSHYRILLVTLDLCAIVAAAVISFELRFGLDSDTQTAVNYLGIGLAIAAGWIVTLQYVGGYDTRHLATGPEEAKRVLRASAATVSVLAIVCYATKTDVARGYVIGVLPLGAVLILLERALVRRFVARRRLRGSWVHRIIATGTVDSVRSLVEVTSRAANAGLKVVGACVEDARVGTEVAPGVPVLGGVLTAAEQAERCEADVVA